MAVQKLAISCAFLSDKITDELLVLLQFRQRDISGKVKAVKGPNCNCQKIP